MGGDYTRWTFDPEKDYSEVFKQQGRVDLDADWNEFVEMIYRRWRAETVDIIGRAVVPDSTPNAFFITPVGTSFNIGIGRMYVDGLLAECHGLQPVVFDPILGELDGTLPVPFNAQPYYPNPIPPPTPGPAVDLVYLDVWQREIIALQDPHIREKALGGPDTTTRMQTVWQVKILPNTGAHACDDDIAAWDTLVAPSAGRLTTSTVVPAPSPDPCILSPTGGYRGLENRLYRVEVHTAGTVGGANSATFKWSRDNGSVVSGVNAISPSGPNSAVTLTSLGRDQVLRFKSGDWVEILDDHTEFSENDFDGTNFVGKPGFLTQIITTPDEAHRIITVFPAIPGGFDPTDPARLTRARRWDQRFTGAGSDVDPGTGLIKASAGPLDIEDGIQVSFSDDPAGGLLHVGDYWLFAARTADGSVEVLQKAPPNGILHHYARLGFMTWVAGGSGTFQDCRHHWPPTCGDCNGACTVTVGDGINSHGQFINDIQAAIDSLGDAGGIVCLGRGVFMVPDTIQINGPRKNVTVRGMGWATRLIFAPDPLAGSRALFDIEGNSHVTLESFFAVAAGAQTMVRFSDSQFCVVRDTALVNLNISPATGSAFLNSEVLSGRAIELAGSCVDCEIENNLILAAKGIISVAGESASTGVGAVSGAVTDATGAVISAATVTLTKPDGTTQTATTDAAGKFSLTSLPAGTYTVAATSGALSLQQTVAVVANSTVDINLQLTAAAAGGRVAATTTTTVAGVSLAQFNINDIKIRDNRFLAPQVSIFLVRTQDCDIVSNQFFGLSKEALAELHRFTVAPGLTRDTIDNLQQAVLSTFTGSSLTQFQAVSIVILFGTRITIAKNVMTSLVGVLSLFLIEARVENNQILAFGAFIVLNGLSIRLSGNFIAGLLAGWLQAGFLLDFESDSNLWIGALGLLFLPFPIFQKYYGTLFGVALQSGGFATSGETVTRNVSDAVISTGGAALEGIGLVGVVKIHDEDFLCFEEGIAAFPGVLTGDISIFDNSFQVFQKVGISWNTPVQSSAVARFLLPIHLIERNTFSGGGIAISCSCLDGVVLGNTIRCPDLAISLACQTSLVQSNTITGTATASSTRGLIEVGPLPGSSENTSCRVAGNRLENGPGHGILITGEIVDLRIEDNVIQSMAQNGITADVSILLQTVRVSGNDISKCRAGATEFFSNSSGAIILPEVQVDLWVHGNRILGNSGIGMFLNGFSSGGPGLCLRVQDNSMDGDGFSQMIVGSGVAVQFTSNQCIQPPTQNNFNALVTLTGQNIVANANTVLGSFQQGVVIPSLELAPLAGTFAVAIATSNILNGSPEALGGATNFAQEVFNNNIAI